ncbi:MAG: TIGR01777 family oxidoreductase [Mucilaginibacter sp.]
MRYHKIVMAGGNGYLGGVLANYYRQKSDEIIILSRKPKPADGNIRTLLWDGRTKGEWATALDGANMLINLCGKNVNCRYNEANKKAIIASRVIPTALLGEVIGELENQPKLWINITSATIYRHAEDRPQDEETGDIGSGFSVDVCKQWESSFFETNTPNTRKIALRMGIVLGMSDSAFPRLLNLVKFGLGGKQGDGQQYMSWIHEQDAARVTEWLLENEKIDGVINCTAPKPIKNTEFMAAIRHAYGTPIGLPAPAWLLALGAAIIGTETELILKSRWVLPGRLTDAGYKFSFEDAGDAIKDLLSTHPQT